MPVKEGSAGKYELIPALASELSRAMIRHACAAYSYDYNDGMCRVRASIA